MPCSNDDFLRLKAAGEYLGAVQVLRDTEAGDERLPARRRRLRTLHDHLAHLVAEVTLIRMPGCLIRRDETGELTILPCSDTTKIKGAKRR